MLGSRKIFQAKFGDVDEILKINLQLHRNISNFRWDQKPWVSREIKVGHFYVLKEDRQTIGAINLKEEGEDELYIETIAIKPEFQKSGGGKRLIEFAKETGKKLHKKKLTVESFHSYNLLEYYQKMGFELDDPPTDIFGGEKFYRFVMEI